MIVPIMIVTINRVHMHTAQHILPHTLSRCCHTGHGGTTPFSILGTFTKVLQGLLFFAKTLLLFLNPSH